MGREIKFRTPYFKLKDDSFSHFSYWGRINYKGESSDTSFTSPGQSSHTYSKDDNQFIGLHDKNDKEVYEGDILCNPNQLKGIVVYHEAGFYLETTRKNGDVWYMPLNSGMLRNKEIIGNIYET